MSFTIFILIFNFTVFNFVILADFTEYIKNYEIAECEVIKSDKKRSAKLRENEDNSLLNLDAEVRLKTQKRVFQFMLAEDESYDSFPFEAHSISKEEKTDTKMYQGVLKSKPFKSSVLGYIHKGLFTGRVEDGGMAYYIEPLKLLTPNITLEQSVVIYKLENVNFAFRNFSFEIPSNVSQWQLRYRTVHINPRSNLTFHPVSLNLDNKTEDLFCDLEIVSHHTLYDFFQGDLSHLKAYLYLHAKNADRIFRKTDFTRRGKPDGIRILASKLSIYKSPHDSNYPMLEASDISEFLEKFVLREQELPFCLSVSMSYLPFKGKAIGEAFKPDRDFYNYLGGLCEKPVEMHLKNSTETLHFNVAAVNLRVKKAPLLPLAISLLAFVHEIAHGFGSDHDNPAFPLCSPKEESIGKYLMHPHTLPSAEQNSMFSPCSRKTMANVIRKKGGCLKTVNSTCGNSIREGDEECDCGQKAMCHLIDPCCIPSDDNNTAEGCTLRNKKGVVCSPKESGCCTQECKVEANQDVTCYVDLFMCAQSFCDGMSPDCPPVEVDTSICLPRMKQEVTNHSVCYSRGMKDCICKVDIKRECHVCCDRNGPCLAAIDMGILDEWGRAYVREEGTACNDGIHRCDGNGNCIDHRRRRLLYLMLGFLVTTTIIMGIFIGTFFYYREQINVRRMFLLRN